MTGGEERAFSTRDLEYVRDLGLIAQDAPLRIANPIYSEIVPRELTYATQSGLMEETAWYVNADGNLDMVKLLPAFQTFFREHSEHWVKRFAYQEAGPQLLLQAFLQRIVNSGGRIEREDGLGRLRTDLLIVWPQGERTRKFVIECKILPETLAQTTDYVDRCDAEAGHLAIFDRREDWQWRDEIFQGRRAAGSGSAIDGWGM